MASKRKRRKGGDESKGPGPESASQIDSPISWAAVCLLLTIAKLGGLLPGLMTVLLGLLFLWSAYSVNRNRAMRRDWRAVLSPALLFLAALFSMYSASFGFPLNEDYSYFSVMIAVFAIFHALAYRKAMDWEFAAVLALALSTLLLHVVPAVQNDLIADLDSYWHLKFMQDIYSTGYPTEYDPLRYPMRGGLLHRGNFSSLAGFDQNGGLSFGLIQYNTPMLMHVTYASVALALKPFGFGMYDIAMLLPAVYAMAIVVVMYLLVKEMFADMRPQNSVAGLAAGFMYMLSPILASKVVATNCEDEAAGMFLMLMALFLFFASYRRKSMLYSVFCGLAFLMLRMEWGGGTYAMVTFAFFGSAYAVMNFLRNRNAMEPVPYIVVPIVFYQLIDLFAHRRGGLPVYHPMTLLETYLVFSAIGFTLVLEMVRARRYGLMLQNDGTFEGRIVDYMERNITAIGVIVLLAGVGLAAYKGPAYWVNFVTDFIGSASGVRSVVHQTVAEQNPMAQSIGDFLSIGYREYGYALYLGLIMVLPMAYLAFARGSPGALFLLVWSLPMMYGAANKSSWIFASGASVTALAGSAGLYAVLRREDFFGAKAAATFLLLIIPLAYVPMFGPFLYSQAVGYLVMHMGPTSDIYQWEPMLEWHANNTHQGDAIMTWWDYGHWITAVAKRPVIADGLQDDYYEIQDLARFFMNKTDEEDAFNIVREYDRAYKAYNVSWGVAYASIDWTMIGKGGALHFIATGDIENATPGSYKNYAQCVFMPQASDLNGQMVTDANGSLSSRKRLVFECENGLAVSFDVAEDGIKGISAMVQDGRAIPWSVFSQQEDASLLGVQPLWGINENEKVPSILFCAMNWNDPRLGICRLPQFNTLVYVPQEFNDYMMTRLYLGKYLPEYRAAGLYNREVNPLRHFREIPDDNGDGTPDGEFSLGFVRSYEISYGGFNETSA